MLNEPASILELVLGRQHHQKRDTENNRPLVIVINDAALYSIQSLRLNTNLVPASHTLFETEDHARQPESELRKEEHQEQPDPLQ